MRTRIAVFVVMLVVGGCGLAGCSHQNAIDGGGRMAANMSALIQSELTGQGEDMSAENRSILENAAQAGAISQDMYDEASSTYQSCVAGLGDDVNWVKQPSGVYKGDPQATDNAALDKYSNDCAICAADGFASIESLFQLQIWNPGLYSDQYEAMYVCISKKGNYLDGVSLDDFRSQVQIAMKGNGPSVITLVDPSNPDVEACLCGNGLCYG